MGRTLYLFLALLKMIGYVGWMKRIKLCTDTWVAPLLSSCRSAIPLSNVYGTSAEVLRVTDGVYPLHLLHKKGN